MDIDIPDAPAMQTMVFDELQHLVGHGHQRSRQILQQFEDGRPITQTAASKLSHHVGMHNHSRPLKGSDKPRVAPPQMVDPD